ncbi:MAG: threonine--tRNA ligase [Nanoarchaeota archaeon]
MRIITLHTDYIEFEVKKKAIKDVPDAPKGKQKIEECLVVLTAVEKTDEPDIKNIVQQLVKEVTNIAGEVKTDKIVLYPYAHLSSNLSSPKPAQEVIELARKGLSKKFKVFSAPFGYYKSFELKCKGHPLSELSREFKPVKDGENKAVAAEKKLKSEWYIIDTTGALKKIKYDKNKIIGFDFSKYKTLEKFAQYELAKVRAVNQEPPHVRLMRKLELVDYEPGSDPGNLRYYPKGRLIKSLLEQFTTEKMIDYGAMEIESPIMYDYEHPSLKSYMNRFPARQYTIQTPNKKVFLRFAACFGQFLMQRDAQTSYKHLPTRLYELTRYSFRAEQHGELTGLRRLRAFTMPDCHAFCADIEQAKEEMLKRLEVSRQLQGEIGFDFRNDFEFAIRVTKEFYGKNKEFVNSLVKKWNKPTLLEIWDKKFFYFILKYEWNYVDNLDKAATLTTDQIDVENAKRYGITYIDSNGKKQFPLILHLSPTGAIERVLYALLERAAKEEKDGKVPTLPLWLSPTQVRLIPVSLEKHKGITDKMMEQFQEANIRVDIDDNGESIGKRIREAELEWVPYIIVIGDKEKDGTITVRKRGIKEQKDMKVESLIKEIEREVKGKPFKKLPLPRYLSKRIRFV